MSEMHSGKKGYWNIFAPGIATLTHLEINLQYKHTSKCKQQDVGGKFSNLIKDEQGFLHFSLKNICMVRFISVGVSELFVMCWLQNSLRKHPDATVMSDLLIT